MEQATGMKDRVWVEKYRPTKVEDVITDHKKEILKAMEKPKSIQSYIFFSRCGGTGKTTLSRAICKDLGCDVLSLNSSDERSIEVVRTKIKDFMMMQSSNTNVKKCVLMDEGEKLTNDAQDSIKNLMETFDKNCFVILTTNNVEKISLPLRNRFITMEFSQPNKDDIRKFLVEICTKEGLTYDDDGLSKLIQIHYPSIRGMIHNLQKLNLNNLSVSVENISTFSSVFDNLWKNIKLGKYKEVRKFIYRNNIDVKDLNRYIFEQIVDKDNLSIHKQIRIINNIASNEESFANNSDDKIAFINNLPHMIVVFIPDFLKIMKKKTEENVKQ